MFMQHTFFQKLIMVVMVGALVAFFYVFVYKGIIVGADQALNGGYSTPKPMHHPAGGPAPTPRRY